jgi:hypothetical protein
MKRVASFTKALWVLLIPVLVCQCSGNYNLVDYKEYGYGKLVDHISYNYSEDGELKSKTRLWCGWGQENTLTLYDVKRYETGIDTIETIYQIYVRDSTDYDQLACKIVTSYTLDGIKRSSTYYGIKDGQWIDNTHDFFDDKGRKIESNMDDRYISYYHYDSLGRYIGCEDRNYIFDNKNDYGFEKDTVIYMSDGRFVIETYYRLYGIDSWEPFQKTQFEFDEKGRIISRYKLDPDETDSIHYYQSKRTYRYDRKGRLRRETVYRQYDSDSMLKKHEETVNRYLLGLKICSLKYNYQYKGKKLLTRFTVYKYDLRHKLLLEEKMYDDIFDKMLLSRKIWIYEKAK